MQMTGLTTWESNVNAWLLSISQIAKGSNTVGGWREQPPRGPPWVSGLVGHFVQTWPDSECSHTVQCLDCSDLI